MKPYDVGGWVGATKADDDAQLRAAYEESGNYVMHVQKGIVPYEEFVRCVGLGPQVRTVRYDPGAPLHARYRNDLDVLDAEQRRVLEDITLTNSTRFGVRYENGSDYRVVFRNVVSSGSGSRGFYSSLGTPVPGVTLSGCTFR